MPRYMIRGVDVAFPFAAYGCQKALMEKVIRACKNSEHALLESPTGTGKSLSLLCSALAWQQSEQDRLNQIFLAKTDPSQPEQKPKLNDTPGKTDPSTPSSLPSQADDSKLDEDAFQAPVKYRRVDTKPIAFGSSFYPSGQLDEKKGTPDVKPIPKKAPIIYYATRTHSQVAQVVAELKRTLYRPRMAVLGSRKHFCIDKSVKTSSSVDEACQDKLENQSCAFRAKSLKDKPELQTGGKLAAWDIEDLVNLGESEGACPYYSSRDLLDGAELVFCPYVYLIDKGIRKNMKIGLEGCVVILDEAHNIEDVAREAASIDLKVVDLQDYARKLDSAGLSVKDETVAQKCSALAIFLNTLITFVQRKIEDMEDETDDSGTQNQVWFGREMMTMLRTLHMPQYKEHRARVEYINDAIDQSKKERKACQGERRKKPAVIKVDSEPLRAILEICDKMEYLYDNDCCDAVNFELAITTKLRQRHVRDDQLHLWCLKPSVAFDALKVLTRAVLLTSGTLCPTDSFASELDVDFRIKAELGHVIDLRKQLWSSVIPYGPDGTSLNATYKNASQFLFKDALGETISRLCSVIPNGILIFFPSYRLMENLVDRWEETGTYQSILDKKPGGIFMEPGRAGSAFDAVLADYRRGVPSGAVLLAVCRGKVSEGIDFKDENARAVLIVGIPFANIRDLEVIRKKKFNDKHAPKLLSGSRWYSLQAFRAVNQAIGRAIRHRFDYGAVVLLDNRFSGESVFPSLPKWIRPNLKVTPTVAEAFDELEEFFGALTRAPPGEFEPIAAKKILSRDTNGDAVKKESDHGHSGTPCIDLTRHCDEENCGRDASG